MRLIYFITFIMIVVACNTATAATSAEIKQKLTEIEHQVITKNWQAAYSLIDSLPDQNQQQRDAKAKIRHAAQAINNFIDQLDKCDQLLHNGSDVNQTTDCYRSAVRDQERIPRKLPFSKELIDDLNLKIEAMNQNIRQVNANMKTLIQDAHAKEEQKGKWEQEGREKYYQLEDKVANDKEYRIISLLCELCEAKRQKKDYESKLKEEQKYSERYGVVNLSKMEQYKQGIMRADTAMRTDAPLFQTATHRQFTTDECKTISEPYKDHLDKSTQKIMRRYFIESLKDYDEEKRNYILKHIEERFPDIKEISE